MVIFDHWTFNPQSLALRRNNYPIQKLRRVGENWDHAKSENANPEVCAQFPWGLLGEVTQDRVAMHLGEHRVHDGSHRHEQQDEEPVDSGLRFERVGLSREEATIRRCRSRPESGSGYESKRGE